MSRAGVEATGQEATFASAVAEALREEMERDERVFLLASDTEADRPAARLTTGLADRFGTERVVLTPARGDAIIGMAVGAAMEGLRPVVELPLTDVAAGGLDELVSVAGTSHYRTGVAIPLVVRGPAGAGVRAGPFHSQSPEPRLAHAPGLKVICPAFPGDAKGLLKSAVRDDNPCVFLEHRWLYRRIREVVPDDPERLVPIGKAEVKRRGHHVTVVTYGAMVHRALEAAEDLAEEAISAEVVDLRTISPLDTEAILESVAGTGRALVVYESLRFLGVGAEVAAMIAEGGFHHLDAPVIRLAPPNVPVPFSSPLEDAFLPQVEDIVEAARKLAKW
jgi:2-oxoisovalerate dehydrogenase E1 component beta subunit